MNVAAVSRTGGEERILTRSPLGRRIHDSPFHVRIFVAPRHQRRCRNLPITFAHRFSSSSGVTETAADQRKSFYDLLGISQDGSFTEIKKAYKDLARKYHPDVSPSADRTEEFTRKFIELKEAYDTLSDPQQRALYDRALAGGLHFAFYSRRRGNHSDEEMKDKTQWRSRWQDQVSELKRRGMNKDQGNLSWGARMRQKRAEES